MLDGIERLTVGLPLYYVWPTKKWKHLKQTIQRLYELGLKHMKEKLEEIKEEDRGRAGPPDKVDFLTYIIHSGKQSLEEAATNAFDLMSAGVNQVSCSVGKFACNHPPVINILFCILQTANSLAWCLYAMGMNPTVQEKLRSEIQSVVGSDKVVTPAHIEQMPYLQGCLKEVLR